MRNTDIQALITATVTPQGPMDGMLIDACAALNGLGIMTRVLLHADGFPNPNLMKALVVNLRESGMPSFILNINAKDELVMGQRDGRPLTIHDAWNIPLVAWMVDHPALHLNYLLNAPENAVIGVIDEGHLAFLRDAGLAPRSHVFCPHGGPPIAPDLRDAADRPIDLLFGGNVNDPGPLPAWLDAQSGGDATLRAALAEGYEAVRADVELYRALSQAFQRRGLNAHPHALAPHIMALDTFIAQGRRIEVLSAVRGRRITLLGNVSPAAAARLEGHDLRGGANFINGISLMASAKVSLSTRRPFARGGHERIFYAMSRGSVIATEPSTFLNEDLDHELGMVRLPESPADIGAMLSDLCGDNDRLDAIRERGARDYLARHGWGERMERILAAVRPHLPA